MNRFRKAALSRRKPTSPIGFDDLAFNERAEKARQQLRKIDAMPKEFRLLVHEYGTKVYGMMRDGRTVEQIKREYRP